MSLTSTVGYGQETTTTPSGFWKKETDSTQYSPRDSSPNASVVHDGKVWILGGYRLDSDTVWRSRSDVWSSEDGVTWELVNENPPYSPYSAFVSFDGFIWALGDISFRSPDGISWDTVHTNMEIHDGSRAIVFNNAIWLTDGTGVYRSYDGYTWDTLIAEAPWEYRVWPGFLAFNNKLWFFGGGINYMTGEDYYFNDVWSSADGIDWVLETESAAWPGRFWFGYATYDDKMWILGGWNYHDGDNATAGNRNDTWYTENGVDWFQLPDSSWQERHAQLIWVFNDALWMSSGYGGLGLPTMYNDVWKLTNTWNEARIPQTVELPDTIVYGEPFPTTQYASSGLPVETATMMSEYPEPGEYVVHLNNEGNSIFAPLDETHTVIVIKKDLLVSVPDYTRSFGAPNPQFTLQFDGFIPGDDETIIEELPTITTNADQYSPVGAYQISLEGGYSSLYNLILKPGLLHIQGHPDLEYVYFPNPVKDVLNVYFSSTQAKRIQIINALGQIEAEVFANTSALALDMTPLATGTYFLRITSLSGSRVFRVVKE
jgi:hypothetical protein